MVDFAHLDCERYRKPSINLQGLETRIVNALAQGMRGGQSPQDVIQSLAQDPALSPFKDELLEFYEPFVAEAKRRIHAEALHKKREKATEYEQKGIEADKKAEDSQMQLRQKLEAARDEAIRMQLELTQQKGGLQQRMDQAHTGYKDTVDQFLGGLDQLLQQQSKQTPNAPNPQRQVASKEAYEVVNQFYQTLARKERGEARKNPVLNHTLAQAADEHAQQRGASLESLLQNPIEQDELFQKLKDVYPKYCNLLKSNQKSFWQQMGEYAASIANAFGSYLKRRALTLAIIAVVAAGAGYAYYRIQGSLESGKAIDVNSLPMLIEEDHGRVAFVERSQQQGVDVLKVRRIQDVDNDDYQVYHLSREPVDALLWTPGGDAVYYRVDISDNWDVVHQIKKIDLGTRETKTVLDMREYEQLGVKDNDIYEMRMETHGTTAGKILIKLGDGTWYRIIDDPESVDSEAKLQLIFPYTGNQGSFQQSCPSGHHWLESRDGNVLMKEGERSIMVGTGRYPVYTPTDFTDAK